MPTNGKKKGVKAYKKEEAAKKKNAKTLAYRKGKGRPNAAGGSKRRVEERSYDSKRKSGSKISIVREKKASAIKKRGVSKTSTKPKAKKAMIKRRK